MRYRIQFLDGSAAVVSELPADARNAVGAIALLDKLDWPPHAVAMRMLDPDSREIHSAIKGVDHGRLTSTPTVRFAQRRVSLLIGTDYHASLTKRSE